MEADEYDTAFFDKRSKFVHYRPRTLAINNLEFDHADIFRRSARRYSGSSTTCCAVCLARGWWSIPHGVAAIDETLAMGCWTPRTSFGIGADCAADWRAELLAD